LSLSPKGEDSTSSLAVAHATLAVKVQNGQAHGQALPSPPKGEGLFFSILEVGFRDFIYIYLSFYYLKMGYFLKLTKN